MLTIGEFSNICRVSTKTLRYYAEIGLILPDEINPENGYRYYSIEQLEKMLLINRLKDYFFSLEEIKSILDSEEQMDEVLFTALNKKKKEIAVKVQRFENTLHQIDSDILNMRNGKSIMSYMESIDVRLVEIPMMYLLSIRKNVLEHEFSEEYGTCFGKLFRKMEEKKLTAAAPPMVLFHGDEYTPFGYHEDLVHSEISLPPNAPKEYADRATLWNAVELSEKGQKSQLARMLKASLPNEWSYELAEEVVRDYVQRNFVDKGMCADWAIHDSENDKGQRNLHIHVLLTMRPLTENGEWEAKTKKVYVLDENGERVPFIDKKTGQQKVDKRNRKQWKCQTVESTDWNSQENARNGVSI